MEKKRYAALSKWTEALEGVHAAVVGKTAVSTRNDPSMMGPDAFGMREEARWGML